MAYRTIDAVKKALIQVVSSVKPDNNLPVIRDNAKVQQRSILGKLVAFFQENPDEHFSIEDIEVRYGAPDVTPETILVNLRRGLLARILSGKLIDGQLHILPGPYVNNLTVCKQRPTNLLGGERIRTSSLMYDTLVRLKSDPLLVLDTAKLGIPNSRFVPTFRFAIQEKLVEVFWENQVRYFKAAPNLANADYIQLVDAPMWALLSKLKAHSSNTRTANVSLTTAQAAALENYLERTLKKQIMESK